MSQTQLQLLVMLTSQISKFFSEVTEICVKEIACQENKKEPSERMSKSHSEEELFLGQPRAQASSYADKETLYKNGKKAERKKRMKKKDPRMPKAPASSYLIYFHQNRKQLQAKYGSNVLPIITKMASKDWSELPVEEKQKYIEKSVLQQQNYRKLMAQYRKNEADKQQPRKEGEGKAKGERKGKKKKSNSDSSSLNSQSISSSSQSSRTASKSSQNGPSRHTMPKKKQAKTRPVIEIASSISSRDSLGKV